MRARACACVRLHLSERVCARACVCARVRVCVCFCFCFCSLPSLTTAIFLYMHDSSMRMPASTLLTCQVRCSDTMTYSFDNVRSQASARMLECDQLICPVHLGKHWTCAVADYQQQTVTYYDSLWVRVCLL